VARVAPRPGAPARAQPPAPAAAAAEVAKGKPRKHAYENFSEWDKFDVDKELDRLDKDEASAGGGAGSAKPGVELIAGLTLSEIARLPAEHRLALALVEKTKGNESFAAKAWTEAVRHYSASLHLDQTSAAVYANRSLAHIKMESWRAAESDASAALEIQANYTKALLRRGIARRRLAKHALALADFRAVLSVEPSHKEAHDYQRAVRRGCAARRASRARARASGRWVGRVCG
jgi:tetratricopeptide (TPR) repeat protein